MVTSTVLSENAPMICDPRGGRPPRARWLLAACLAFAQAGPLRAAGAGAAKPALPLAARLAESVASAQKLVEKVRGVPFPGVVPSAVLPEKDLAAVLEKKLAEDLPVPFERYTASLDALGLIDDEPGLQKRITGLYARQVAGFYDPAEGKFYIVPERSNEAATGLPALGSDAAGLMEEVLLTHELTHALQDRRLGLDRRMKDLKESSDGLLALECVLEGEATVVMTDALVSRLPEESRGLFGSDTLSQMMAGLAAGGGDIEGAQGVPDFFVKELLFPYVAGTAWIQKKRAGGGWSAVDAAYRNLPATTSEILHAERPAGQRLRLGDEKPGPRDLPAGTRRLYSDSLGEWILKTLLERAGSSSAGALAADWQDDHVLFFEARETAGGPVGFVWRLRMATPSAARRLSEALAGFYGASETPPRATLRVSGDVLSVVRGRTASAGRPTVPRGTSGPRAER
jgi:hypothetical protein